MEDALLDAVKMMNQTMTRKTLFRDGRRVIESLVMLLFCPQIAAPRFLGGDLGIRFESISKIWASSRHQCTCPTAIKQTKAKLCENMHRCDIPAEFVKVISVIPTADLGQIIQNLQQALTIKIVQHCEDENPHAKIHGDSMVQKL